jgi:hypothetical protein
MTESRPNGRKKVSRAFQPSLGGQLEDRVLLTHQFELIDVAHGLLKHTTPRAARNVRQPPFLARDAPHFNQVRPFRTHFAIATQTARGGQNVEITALDGSHYMVTLSYTSNTLATNIAEGANGQAGVSSPAASAQQVSQQAARYPQPIGTVRAYPMPGGRVGIIVDGSTLNTELSINPLGIPQRKGFAHSFAYGEANRGNVLNIGQITINSGSIGAILGYQSAQLSGPLVSNGPGAIDRIALAQLLPGASITVGGDLNTLDVLTGADLSGAGTGIFIGRDLNLLNIGGNLQLSNGAVVSIGRNLGLVPQPPKGTGTGSNVLLLNFNQLTNTTITTVLPPTVATFLQGNVIINPGSQFLVGANIGSVMYVEGNINGFSRILVKAATGSATFPTFLTQLPPAGTTQTFINVVVALGGGEP